MRYRNLISRSCLIAMMAVGFASSAAKAQTFDQRMSQILGAAIQQNADSQARIWQYHLQVNGPRLRAQYAQLKKNGYPFSFADFAYWDMMTAGGTNIAGAQRAQQDRFEGWQGAHRTVQSGGQDYINGLAENSRRTTAAVENYSNGAILGISPYINPGTGATQMLPYYSPPGQVFNSGGNYYYQDQSGTYHQWVGNSWTQMRPGR